MLQQAREFHLQLRQQQRGSSSKNAVALDDIEYVEQDFEQFVSRGGNSGGADLIFSNAALHWVNWSSLQELLPGLVDKLNPGGVLAFQVPDTRQQPSHLLMRQAVENLQFDHVIDEAGGIRIPTSEVDPGEYYQLLAPYCESVDVWSTKYLHVLSAGDDDVGDDEDDNDEKKVGSGDETRKRQRQHPVVQFTGSTGLRPYLQALRGQDSENGQEFLSEYERLVADAYPIGTKNEAMFEFNRLFVVCRKKL